jgi:hypothetical protein
MSSAEAQDNPTGELMPKDLRDDETALGLTPEPEDDRALARMLGISALVGLGLWAALIGGVVCLLKVALG